MLISPSKFFKDNKIARARRARAICSLWKIYKCLLHQIESWIKITKLNHVITCIIFMKKNITESQDRRNTRTLCSLYSGYNFDSSYIRMHSFSANHKHEIFSCTLLNLKFSLIVRFFLGILQADNVTYCVLMVELVTKITAPVKMDSLESSVSHVCRSFRHFSI